MAEAATTTCYHRVGDGEVAPRRRRRVRVCALLGALVLGWCLLSTTDKSSTDDDDLWTQPQEPQEPQQHALREVRAVRGWLNHTLTVEAGVWHLPHGISFHTRLYNGVVPSPVGHAEAGMIGMLGGNASAARGVARKKSAASATCAARAAGEASLKATRLLAILARR